jgi:hypothetical protein
MSNQIVIPDNNLPVCVQRYEFKFTENDGIVTWTTACAIPSNLSTKRVWNFNISGNIDKKLCRHILRGDFSQVKTFGYKISFEGPIQGTITINGRVLDANKYMDYRYDPDTLVMRFMLKNLNEIGLFELNLVINDTTATRIVERNTGGGIPPFV